jgi:hypothetical protein
MLVLIIIPGGQLTIFTWVQGTGTAVFPSV